MNICLLDLVLLLNLALLPVDLLVVILWDFLLYLRLLPLAIGTTGGTGAVSGAFTTGSGACLVNTGAGAGLFNTTRFFLAGGLKISLATATGCLPSLFSNSLTAFCPNSFTFCLPRFRACLPTSLAFFLPTSKACLPRSRALFLALPASFRAFCLPACSSFSPPFLPSCSSFSPPFLKILVPILPSEPQKP